MVGKFNDFIYSEKIKRINLQEELKKLINYAADDVLVVLRVHLMCESILEAWVCASIERVDFFDSPVKLKLTFSNKLAIARNLSLPTPAFMFFKSINDLRNDFSHNFDYRNIPPGQSSSLKDLIPDLSTFAPSDVTIEHNSDILHGISDQKTPERIKLCLLFLFFPIQLQLALATKPEVKEDKKTATLTMKL